MTTVKVKKLILRRRKRRLLTLSRCQNGGKGTYLTCCLPLNAYSFRHRSREDSSSGRNRILLQNEAWEAALPAMKDAYMEFDMKGPPVVEPGAHMHPAIWVVEMFGEYLYSSCYTCLLII